MGSWGRRKQSILGRGNKRAKGLGMGKMCGVLSSVGGVAAMDNKAGCFAEPGGWPLKVEGAIKA